MRIVLATANPAKQEALIRLLRGLDIEPVLPEHLGLREQSIEEAGPTYSANALAKAKGYARAAGEAAISSDGGLEIPSLGDDWDGLHTRRFSGPADDDRLAALLRLLRDTPPERRNARFHEAIAVVSPQQQVIAQVECAGQWGRLAETVDPRWKPGFWIPAVWLYPPRWVTEWDLSDNERDSLMTSWDALRARLLPILRCYLTGRQC